MKKICGVSVFLFATAMSLSAMNVQNPAADAVMSFRGLAAAPPSDGRGFDARMANPNSPNPPDGWGFDARMANPNSPNPPDGWGFDARMANPNSPNPPDGW